MTASALPPLQAYDIDWGWPRLSEPERQTVRRYEARLDATSSTQTRASATSLLLRATSELTNRPVRARLEDAQGEHFLSVVAGTPQPCREEEYDPDGEFPGILRAADYRAAGLDHLEATLFWPEQTLERLLELAGQLHRSLSWLVQQASFLARNQASDPCAQELAKGSGSAGLTRGGAPRRHSVELQVDTFEYLLNIAEDKQLSLSEVVLRTLAHAWPTLRALNAGPKEWSADD